MTVHRVRVRELAEGADRVVADPLGTYGGSATMIVGLRRFIITRCHMIGWAMQGLAPMKTRTSLSSKSA